MSGAARARRANAQSQARRRMRIKKAHVYLSALLTQQPLPAHPWGPKEIALSKEYWRQGDQWGGRGVEGAVQRGKTQVLGARQRMGSSHAAFLQSQVSNYSESTGDACPHRIKGCDCTPSRSRAVDLEPKRGALMSLVKVVDFTAAKIDFNERVIEELEARVRQLMNRGGVGL